MTIEAMKQALEALELTADRMQKQRDAITSLRQAIEQAEKQVCVGCEGNPQGENIPCAVCGATPQPQREWVGLTEDEYKNIRYGQDECGDDYVEYELFDEGEYGFEVNIYVDRFAKAIEAKLKEKNT